VLAKEGANYLVSPELFIEDFAPKILLVVEVEKALDKNLSERVEDVFVESRPWIFSTSWEERSFKRSAHS